MDFYTGFDICPKHQRSECIWCFLQTKLAAAERAVIAAESAEIRMASLKEENTRLKEQLADRDRLTQEYAQLAGFYSTAVEAYLNLSKVNIRYSQALEFYADHKHYFGTQYVTSFGGTGTDPTCTAANNVVADCGARARAALTLSAEADE